MQMGAMSDSIKSSKMLTPKHPFLLSATDLFSCDVLCVGCYEEPGLAEALCGLAAPTSGDQGTAAPLVA